jgi:hypothetical protein
VGELLVDIVDDGPTSGLEYMTFLAGMGSSEALSATFLKFSLKSASIFCSCSPSLYFWVRMSLLMIW